MRMPVPPSCGTLGKVLRRSSSATTENYTQERAGGERPRLRKVPCWASGAGLSPATHFRSRCLFSVPGNRALFPAARQNGSMAAAELREALELRLDQLAIRTEVVEHPEVRGSGRCQARLGSPNVPRLSQKRSLWGISRVPEYKGNRQEHPKPLNLGI